jgi:formate dehydrogenase major subunit
MDSCLLALGNRPDLTLFHGESFASKERTELPVDALTLQTPRPALFVAGDVVTGPSSVVEAMASGKRAALSIDRYVRGESLTYGRRYAGPFLTGFPAPVEGACPAPRQSMRRHIPVGAGDMRESALGYSASQARDESARCLSCGVPVGYYDACWYCLPCEVSCPEKALAVHVPYLVG